jgi:hypothetical protein
VYFYWCKIPIIPIGIIVLSPELLEFHGKSNYSDWNNWNPWNPKDSNGFQGMKFQGFLGIPKIPIGNLEFLEWDWNGIGTKFRK